MPSRPSNLRASLSAALVAFLAPVAVHAQTRSPWQMNRGEGIIVLPRTFMPPTVVDPIEYTFATIPAPLDPNWTSAPDANVLGLHMRSSLCDMGFECGGAADFTYFRTIVCIPDPRDLGSVRVEIGTVDDAARLTVFNSAFPRGITPSNGFVGLGGGSVRAGEFATSLRSGERNTLVFTHIDHCCGNTEMNPVTLFVNDRAVLPSTLREVCNGLDDDCNGAVDEGLGSTRCGIGACARAVANCIGGITQMCRPGLPASETCNGVDDDCNGRVDDGCDDAGVEPSPEPTPEPVPEPMVEVTPEASPEPSPDAAFDATRDQDSGAMIDAGFDACTNGRYRCDPSQRLEGRAGPIGACRCSVPGAMRTGRGSLAMTAGLAGSTVALRRRRKRAK